jgi:hypothetical protein
LQYSKHCFSILDFYQLTNSTTDFKSRLNDVFDKLTNLEKEHDVHIQSHTPVTIPDDETPATSQQNPTIPNNAIVLKKRPADDNEFIRPVDKWQKYDLDNVNEHHLSGTGNRHALNDFLRTRVKPSITPESEKQEEEMQSIPIFKRPMKKPILTNDDDDDNQFIPIRAPLPSDTNETKIDNTTEDDEAIDYKLKSTGKKPRGVLSKTVKKSTKPSIVDDDIVEDEEELFDP